MNNFNWLKAGTYSEPTDTQQIFNIDEIEKPKYFKVYFVENDGYIKIKNKNGVTAFAENEDISLLLKVDRGTIFNISVQDGMAAIIIYNACALISSEVERPLQMFRGGAMISMYSSAETTDDINSTIDDLIIAFTTT